MCTDVHMYKYIYIDICIHMCVCTYVFIHLSICASLCVCIYIHIYIYTDMNHAGPHSAWLCLSQEVDKDTACTQQCLPQCGAGIGRVQFTSRMRMFDRGRADALLRVLLCQPRLGLGNT